MKPKILVLTKRVKSYWKSPFAQKRVTNFIESKNSSFFKLFQAASYGFLKSASYDLVICADPRIGVFYGLLKTLFKGKTPIIIDQLILSDRRDIIAKLKDLIYRLSLHGVDGVIVNSSFEKGFYQRRLAVKTKFFFIPIPADDFWYEKFGDVRNYIFSGGGEKRDFKLIIEAAKRINTHFKIVTFFPKDIETRDIPPNCEIIYGVSNKRYLRLIGNSLFVVIPLKKTAKSAGQTTLVQAMCQGKAVIIADNPALSDYAKESAIFYEPGNQSDLLAKIKLLLKNQNLQEKLGQNALKKAREEFTYGSHDKRIGEIIDLCIKS